ncbi:MAG: tRNA preQ1(34) S-adenosylmethionine ribosyltransferase-isomerase QueA [Thermomicrobiales bacterium]
MSGKADRDLLVADFDYDLPPELIAQEPLADRSRSRLLVLNRRTGEIVHSTISEISSWLAPGDLLVANNTRVLPARLFAHKSGTGGRVELLLLRRIEAGDWVALAKSTRKLRPGLRLDLEPVLFGEATAPVEIVQVDEVGPIVIRFLDRADLRLDRYGTTPLPPYIHTLLADPERYQAVYASRPGSAAAPTAGLHLTPTLIEDFQARGIGWAEVTLHIGLDTFRPVTVERVADHVIHREWCAVSDEVAGAVANARAAGRRVVAVGTTAARTLESLGPRWERSRPAGFAGPTDIFITPGYTWRVVDALLTNFHLPRSTLLMMVSALAGRDVILQAYREAIARRYRFYSFGDAMLII